MKQVFRTEAFNADFDTQYRWYLEQAGENTAAEFKSAVAITLRSLGMRPDLGRPRKFRQAALRGLRSCQVKQPFNKILIFYRLTEEEITVWRMIHGSRDLPRRLAEPLNLSE